jgi:peptide deformylase
MSLLTLSQHQIWTVQNSQQEKFLRTPVPEFDMQSVSKKDLEELVIHMRRMMVQERGVGLSANQIGLSVRAFVCQLPTRDGAGYQGKFYAVFNPRITKISEKKNCDQEGCLSIPGLYGDVDRYTAVIVEGFTKHNRPILINAKGFLARIMQHEIDHLNGKLFTDIARDTKKISDL